MFLATIDWRDPGTGKLAQTTLNITSGWGGGSLVAALQAHSNANNSLTAYSWAVAGLFGAVGAGAHRSVADRALLVFDCANGGTVKFMLWAPTDDVFLGDGETVDSSAISDIISAVVANCASPSGSAVTNFAYGHLATGVPRLQ